LASLATGRPFTLQYARERVPEKYWHAPLFLPVNRRIAWAWAGAFAVMSASHAAVVFVPAEWLWLDIVVTIFALALAFSFTAWYPAYVRKKTELS
jgi:Flp pilus assembly protein TadB